MAKRSRVPKLKWKNMGFIPHGCDDSKMLKHGDPGFLFLCQQLRDDWRKFSGFTIKDRTWRPGRKSGSSSFDWAGLEDAVYKPGAHVDPPDVGVRVQLRKLTPEERETFGRDAYRTWVAVRSQHKVMGQDVPDEELRPWGDLAEAEKEVFRNSAASLAEPEQMFWDGLAQVRKQMGEKAFRKKMFELSVSVAIEKMLPSVTEAERFWVTDMVVKLSGMLEVPQAVDHTG